MLLIILWLGPFILATVWAVVQSNRFFAAYEKRYGGLLRRDEALQGFLNDPFFAFTSGRRDTLAGIGALRRPVDDPEIEALRLRARRWVAVQLLWLFLGWLPAGATISALSLPTELDPGIAGWLGTYLPGLFYLALVAGWLGLFLYWLRRPAPRSWWLVRLLGLAFFAVYMLYLITRGVR